MSNGQCLRRLNTGGCTLGRGCICDKVGDLTKPTPEDYRKADLPSSRHPLLDKDHPAVKLLLRVYNEIDPDPTLEDEIGKYLKTIGIEDL